MNSHPSRALVVIDVQNEYFTGKLRIQFPDRQKSLENIGRAIDAANRHSIPVVIVQNCAPANAPVFARGSDGWKLHSEVARRERSHHVEKTRPSAMTETDLAAWARASGVNTLTLIGYMTHNCIASTAVEALHAGFSVEVLNDAIGTLAYRNSAGLTTPEEMHRVFCVVFQSRFAAVLDTSAWIEAAARGEAVARSSILLSSQAALEPVAAPG